MMTTDEIKKELDELVKQREALQRATYPEEHIQVFILQYQAWYSRAYKLVEALGPERLDEFTSYYLRDPKRKSLTAENYVIQDFTNGLSATDGLGRPRFDHDNLIRVRIMNQVEILRSLSSRIDSVLQDVTGHLFAELQDSELEAAIKLKKVSLRASGALAGVVLERHLQRVAANHKIKITKKSPTIADLNDPLKKAEVYDVATWRRIQLLGDLRNLCSHQKDKDPTAEQVDDLISGVNTIVKSVF